MRSWNRFSSHESGQGLVEYVLIIALIAIGLIAAILMFRSAIGRVFGDTADTLTALEACVQKGKSHMCF